MKTSQSKYLFFLVLSIFLITSCVQDSGSTLENEIGYLQTRSGSVNQDGSAWEDRVNSLRMIVFEPSSQQVVFNRLLDFEGEIAQNKFSKPIALKVGEYNFLFIANEGSYDGLSSQLDAVRSQRDFNGAYFKQLKYENLSPQGFKPTKKKPFLMSAYYSFIKITPSTIENPLIFTDNEGYQVVSLIRTFSKVNIQLRQAINGGVVEYTDSRVENITLSNIPGDYVLPASELGYTMSSTFLELSFPTGLQEVDYKKTDGKIGQFVLYVPELIRDNTSSTLPVSLSFSGSNISSEQYNLISTIQAIDESREVPMPILPMDIASNSLIRSVEYLVDVVLLPKSNIAINYIVKDWTIEEIDLKFQPSVINLSTKDVLLQDGVGTLFFDFVDDNGVEAPYMSFFKITDSANTSFAATALKVSGSNVYKLTFTVPSTSPTRTTKEGYIYFENIRAGVDKRQVKIKLSIH